MNDGTQGFHGEPYLKGSGETLPSEGIRKPTFNEGDEGLLVRSVTEDASLRPTAKLIEKLYADLEHTTPEFRTAIRLLKEVQDYLALAIRELEDQQPVRSDNEVLKVRALMPELFACRSLGDGFGSIILAVQTALVANADTLLTIRELTALQKVVAEARNHPFMSHFKAVDLIEFLEEQGLQVNLEGIDHLAELLDGVQ